MKHTIVLTLILLMQAISTSVAQSPSEQITKAPSRGEIIYPPNANPFGLSQSRWLVKYTAWWISVPAERNPMLDPDGRFCQENQSGPVFYLGSVFIDPGGEVVRNCTVRASKAIYIPLAGSQCSPLTDGTTTPAESLACARFYTDNSLDLFVEVDGRRVTWRHHRFSTRPFDVDFPADSLLGNPDPITVKDMVADAFAVMLPPQSVGRHVIRVGGKNHLFPGLFWDLTVNLTVRPGGNS